MANLVERYNGIEQDPEGVYVMFKEYERLQAALQSITKVPPYLQSRRDNYRDKVDSIQEIASKALNETTK